MPSRVTLRVCAKPLMPQHLVAVLATIPGMGYGHDETQTFGRGYHEVAMQACRDEIERDPDFQAAIKGKFHAPIQRPLSKLDARNQFLALAPSLEICDLTPKTETVLEPFMNGPFVITFRTLGSLERARASDEDPETTSSRLSGFIEHYLGCSAALFYERADPLGNLFRSKADA